VLLTPENFADQTFQQVPIHRPSCDALPDHDT
jgi:hypothetical protein